MILRDIVEEIIEKSPNRLSPKSLVRKVTQVRDRLLRNYGSTQVQETVCTGIDIIAGQSQYILPCPPKNVIDVDILESAFGGSNKWQRLSHRQFNRDVINKYYYFLENTIGIMPEPIEDVPTGLKIFHIPSYGPLTVKDMDNLPGFDPDYGMVLVYGVLREITTGKQAEEYDLRYQQLLNEYSTASSGFASYIKMGEW